MPDHSRMRQMLSRRRELAPAADVGDGREEAWVGFCDELDALRADPDLLIPYLPVLDPASPTGGFDPLKPSP